MCILSSSGFFFLLFFPAFSFIDVDIFEFTKMCVIQKCKERQMKKMCDSLADACDPTMREGRRVTAAARTARSVHVGYIQLVLVLVQATSNIRDVTDRNTLSA